MLLVSIGAAIAAVGVYAVSRKVFFNIEIAVLRIPIYFIGMYCASLSLENRNIPSELLVILAFSVPVKLIAQRCGFPFARLFNAPYAIFLVLVYLIIRKNARRGSKGFVFLSNVGNYSLELYIVHVAVRALMRTAGLDMANPGIYGACMLISIPISIGYSRLHKALWARNK